MAERAGVAEGLGNVSRHHPYYKAAVVWNDNDPHSSGYPLHESQPWDYEMYLNAELACACLGTFPEGSDPEVWVRSSEGIWEPYSA